MTFPLGTSPEAISVILRAAFVGMQSPAFAVTEREGVDGRGPIRSAAQALADAMDAMDVQPPIALVIPFGTELERLIVGAVLDDLLDDPLNAISLSREKKMILQVSRNYAAIAQKVLEGPTTTVSVTRQEHGPVMTFQVRPGRGPRVVDTNDTATASYLMAIITSVNEQYANHERDFE